MLDQFHEHAKGSLQQQPRRSDVLSGISQPQTGLVTDWPSPAEDLWPWLCLSTLPARSRLAELAATVNPRPELQDEHRNRDYLQHR